ncbi:MAG: LysM peptidoglycan-binding domain-containing protein [Leptonema sp. (in: bacteria)]
MILKRINFLFAIMIGIYYIQCGKPVPTEELVKAREEIEIAKSKKIEGESEDFLNQAIETLKNAHSKLPEENYEESKKLAQQSYILSQLSESISLPIHIEKKKENYNKKIQEAYEANAEILAKADYESAKSLYEQAEEENKLKELALTEDEKNQLATGTFKSDSERKQTEEKLQNFVNNSAHVESKLEKALNAAKISYETSISHKQEYSNQLNNIKDKFNSAKKYNIQEYEPEKSSLLQKEIEDTQKLIQNNQLRLAHQNIEKLNKDSEELFLIAIAKYSEDLFVKAEKSFKNTEKKVKESSGVLTEPKTKEKIQETLQAAEEAYKNAKSDLVSKNYESSIANSNEVLKLSKIVMDLVDNAQLAYTKRELSKEQEKQPTENNEKITIEETTEIQKDDNIKLIHVVKPKEYLWKISGYKHIYNDPKKWKKIYEANKDQIKNPNLVYPNQKLKILKNGND